MMIMFADDMQLSVVRLNWCKMLSLFITAQDLILWPKIGSMFIMSDQL